MQAAQGGRDSPRCSCPVSPIAMTARRRPSRKALPSARSDRSPRSPSIALVGGSSCCSCCLRILRKTTRSLSCGRKSTRKSLMVFRMTQNTPELRLRFSFMMTSPSSKRTSRRSKTTNACALSLSISRRSLRTPTPPALPPRPPPPSRQKSRGCGLSRRHAKLSYRPWRSSERRRERRRCRSSSTRTRSTRWTSWRQLQIFECGTTRSSDRPGGGARRSQGTSSQPSPRPTRRWRPLRSV
mmetsp:Transcript_54069/g.105795  ORF Transcript_54069/g.105795 Transcript_54069/m.105795 type:complete len:240 (+) Transcript_54069:853-1572(+)